MKYSRCDYGREDILTGLPRSFVVLNFRLILCSQGPRDRSKSWLLKLLLLFVYWTTDNLPNGYWVEGTVSIYDDATLVLESIECWN